MIVMLMEEQGRVPIERDLDRIVRKFMKTEKLKRARLYAGKCVNTLVDIVRLSAGMRSTDYRILFLKSSEDRIISLDDKQQNEFVLRAKRATEQGCGSDLSHIEVLKILNEK